MTERVPSTGDQEIELVWQGRQIFGLVGMRDLARMLPRNTCDLPPIDTDQTDRDFAVFIGTQPVTEEAVTKILERGKDPRVLLWSPANCEGRADRLIDFAAYRKLMADWEGKETEDAVAVINWVANSLQSDLGRDRQDRSPTATHAAASTP